MKKIFTLIALACMAVSVNAQNTYILNINKIYEDAAAKTGACANATLNDGSTTKYLLNDATIVQDVFTVVSKSNRTFRTDLFNADGLTQDYGDYVATYRLEPNGASNSTGGRQMFVEVANAGKLYIGAWGNAGRTVFVAVASDKTSYVKFDDVKESAKFVHAFTADDATSAVYEVELEPGLFVISQDAGIYYAYIKFVENGSASVSSIKAEQGNGASYNLAGQKVGAGYKGLVIKNGRKYMK